MQRKKNKTFWKNIRFKYKVSIINENTLEEITNLKISKLNGLSIILFTSFVIFLISSCIIIFTPLRNYLPGYVNSEIRSQIVYNKIYTDSISDIIRKQSIYINNIKDILSDKVNIDTVSTTESSNVYKKDTLINRTQREDDFRKKYEDTEKYNLTNITANQTELTGLNFFRPIRGIVINTFNPSNKHYGIDVSVEQNDNILSILDGTIIFCNYTGDFGYCIAIQHSNNIISIYKHCGNVLKQTGEMVKAGEAIALTNNKSERNIKHLHFELWYKGKAIDPNKYIVF